MTTENAKNTARLAPKGQSHGGGAVLEPIPVDAFSLLVGQRSLSGPPVGSPATTDAMNWAEQLGATGA